METSFAHVVESKFQHYHKLKYPSHRVNLNESLLVLGESPIIKRKLTTDKYAKGKFKKIEPAVKRKQPPLVEHTYCRWTRHQKQQQHLLGGGKDFSIKLTRERHSKYERVPPLIVCNSETIRDPT